MPRTCPRPNLGWQSVAQSDTVAVMDAEEIRRAITRIAHEIIERNRGASELVLVGIQRKGVPLAERIKAVIEDIEKASVPFGTLDISLHRDDYSSRLTSISPTDIPHPLEGRTVVLVDDVMFTGRSTRSALEALISFGRPGAIQLAVLVDRGHRELPLRADYVGKNVPTARNEDVQVQLGGDPAQDRVTIVKPSGEAGGQQ